ncbi:hypothetical protein GCM10023093_17550 [Nemorincola caseinilytica]|uniref:Ferritin-like domain-containing protein n=1 Tax=Nemorincola caseinilytica TaxID=2054315 RepID=A0ABP8NH82_9BACT
MNFKHIISEIEKTDPEVYERLSGRREMLGSFGSKVALAALPLALASMFKKAYGQSTDVVVNALNLALEFEFMQHTYYRQGTNTGSLIPAQDLPGFKIIESQEKAHVAFLEKVIAGLGGVAFRPKYYTASTTVHPYVPAAYDFTMGGKFTPFADYETFLTIAQVLEDTYIHAIHGQTETLQANNAVLSQVFALAAVEGRHAAYVRLRRRLAVGAAETPTPWIQNNIPPVPSLSFQKYYLGEDNTIQKSVDIQGLSNVYYANGAMPQVAATAAFDEPYTKENVMNLIAPFKKL